jgi:hypothetical protein
MNAKNFEISPVTSSQAVSPVLMSYLSVPNPRNLSLKLKQIISKEDDKVESENLSTDGEERTGNICPRLYLKIKP